jgi:hypothetical protein
MSDQPSVKAAIRSVQGCRSATVARIAGSSSCLHLASAPAGKPMSGIDPPMNRREVSRRSSVEPASHHKQPPIPNLDQ